MPARPPTRQRLLDAGLRLFAEQGFTATTVGDIESAAGLQPRRGGLYKHFASKDALLAAAVERHLDDVATGAAQLAELDVAAFDRRTLGVLALEAGRWFLAELDRQEAMTRVLERDGERVTAVRDLAYERIVQTGNAAAAALVRAVVADGVDAEALAVVLLGGLVALRRTRWTFGAPALGVDDDRALAAWADLCLVLLDRPA